MADGTTPGAPSGAPADLATQVTLATAIVHLMNRLHGGGPPPPAPFHETKQVRRQSGPARDRKGRFKPRQ